MTFAVLSVPSPSISFDKEKKSLRLESCLSFRIGFAFQENAYALDFSLASFYL